MYKKERKYIRMCLRPTARNGFDRARACLKNHSRHLHAPLCVIFAPNSGYITRYAPFIWRKSPTNCDANLTESIFQTRSSPIIERRFPLCKRISKKRGFPRKRITSLSIMSKKRWNKLCCSTFLNLHRNQVSLLRLPSVHSFEQHLHTDPRQHRHVLGNRGHLRFNHPRNLVSVIPHDF